MEIEEKYRTKAFLTASEKSSGLGTAVWLRKKIRLSSAVGVRQTSCKSSKNQTELEKDVSRILKGGINLKYKEIDQDLLIQSLQLVNRELQSEAPDYLSLVSLGLIRDMLDLYKNFQRQDVFLLVSQGICDFLAAPACTLERSLAEEILDSLILNFNHFQSSLLFSVFLTSLANVFDEFTYFYKLRELSGLALIQSSCQDFAFSYPILSSLSLFCKKFCGFSDEFNQEELDAVNTWVNELKKYNEFEYEVLEVINSVYGAGKHSKRLSDETVEFLISEVGSVCSEASALSCQVIGNLSILSSLNLTDRQLLTITQSLQIFSSSKDLRYIAYWLLKSLLIHRHFASLVFNSPTYTDSSAGLHDPSSKVRKQAIKFYSQLFQTVYFASNNIIVPVNFFNNLSEAISDLQCPQLSLSCLKLFKVILRYIESNDYIIINLQASQLLDSLDMLCYNANPKTSLKALMILEALSLYQSDTNPVLLPQTSFNFS